MKIQKKVNLCEGQYAWEIKDVSPDELYEMLDRCFELKQTKCGQCEHFLGHGFCCINDKECPNNRWYYGVDVGDGEDHSGYIGIFDGKVVPLPKDEIR